MAQNYSYTFRAHKLDNHHTKVEQTIDLTTIGKNDLSNEEMMEFKIQECINNIDSKCLNGKKCSFFSDYKFYSIIDNDCQEVNSSFLFWHYDYTGKSIFFTAAPKARNIFGEDTFHLLEHTQFRNWSAAKMCKEMINQLIKTQQQ